MSSPSQNTLAALRESLDELEDRIDNHSERIRIVDSLGPTLAEVIDDYRAEKAKREALQRMRLDSEVALAASNAKHDRKKAFVIFLLGALFTAAQIIQIVRGMK